ncbi:hypothetical protein GIB67_024621 [Kingdonia uniflora]|uniref:Cns1/TTC4 wheel domain-containing protein n=1 Tax=Kingdonia uniflora TaxID=39325 RepID=A0A7J7LPH1_9MAGN|nr:hypothetical protein GIB67_024621 [Kingdonia uniflora]
MALWMESGSEPLTQNERADLDAISAIKESAALDYKEKGNEYVKMGNKYYSDAVDCYTKAINQNALTDSDTSLIFSNRAHVNLLLGNYRRALDDAKGAIKLSTTNIKAYYRAAKAAFSLDLFTEALSFCKTGLQLSPDNEELNKLVKQIDLRNLEKKTHEAQVSQAVAMAKDLASAIENRGLRLGKATYKELTGIRKPVLDKNNILHWPVVLLYPEVMSSDFIEDFCEIDMFSTHLDMMFSESSLALPWDKEHTYTREAVELYYEVGSGAGLSRLEVVRHLVEGTAGSLAESIGSEDIDTRDCPNHDVSPTESSIKWVKVNEKKTLLSIMRQSNYIVPGIPVFYVVSKCSSFYKVFKDGKWSPPLS